MKRATVTLFVAIGLLAVTVNGLPQSGLIDKVLAEAHSQKALVNSNEGTIELTQKDIQDVVVMVLDDAYYTGVSDIWIANPMLKTLVEVYGHNLNVRLAPLKQQCETETSMLEAKENALFGVHLVKYLIESDFVDLEQMYNKTRFRRDYYSDETEVWEKLNALHFRHGLIFLRSWITSDHQTMKELNETVYSRDPESWKASESFLWPFNADEMEAYVMEFANFREEIQALRDKYSAPINIAEAEREYGVLGNLSQALQYSVNNVTSLCGSDEENTADMVEAAELIVKEFLAEFSATLKAFLVPTEGEKGKGVRWTGGGFHLNADLGSRSVGNINRKHEPKKHRVVSGGL